MRLKIDWASLIVGSKFTVFALFHNWGRGGGNLTAGFFALPDWGSYIWRGLYNTFYTKLMKLIEHPLLCQNLCQGYPTTVFGELSVRGSKYCLEFSLLEEDVKILRSPFLSGIIFEAYLISSLRFSEVYTQTP